MQYQSECLSALKSVVNIHKTFEKTFMDTMKLFMTIPDRINFLQLGRYGCFSEQTYRNLFENETFDWFAFNASIISKHWYSSYLITRKDKLQSISKTLVADAFFSKETFITPMCESDFHVISRFRNDVVLYYPTLEKKTGKRGHPKWFDGRIDFSNLDLTRCKKYKVNKGKLYGLRVYAKAFKRYASLAVWYPMDGRIDKWQLYFSTDDSMDGREVLDYYRTRFQLEFCFRDGK